MEDSSGARRSGEERGTREAMVGAKLRALRERAGLGPAALAQKAGVSVELLERLESGREQPSIATLLALARPLDVGLSHFFKNDGPERRIEVTRREDRATVHQRHGDGPGAPTYTYEALTHNVRRRHMQPLLVEFDLLAPGAPEPQLVSHEGEEFLFILDGEVEFRAEGQQRIVLRTGDSLYFESVVPHVFVGLGDRKPRAVAVVYAPQ